MSAIRRVAANGALMTRATGLAERASEVVRVATERLKAGTEGFQQTMSVGVLGSCARGDLSVWSDVDYYVVLDTSRVGSDHLLANMERNVRDVAAHVQATLKQNLFARRLSVFWSPLASLRTGDYSVGRWPAYDRQALIEHGQHIAGFRLTMGELPAVSRDALITDAIALLLDVIRPRIGAAQLLERPWSLPAVAYGREEILVAKAILMPLRLLYMLEPRSLGRPIVSTDEAGRVCRRKYRKTRWWSLAESLLEWRSTGRPPRDDEPCQLRLVQLYEHTVEAYVSLADDLRMLAGAKELRGWLRQLTRLRALGSSAR